MWTVNKLGVKNLSMAAAASDTQEHGLGETVIGEHPYWGSAKFVYGRYMAAISRLGVAVLDPTYNTGEARYRIGWNPVPNTANTGKCVGIAMANGSGGQFGWFMVEGVVPAQSSASVAADTACGVTAAGQIGAISNGKQILRARVIRAATTTVTTTGHTAIVGTTRIQVKDTTGFFPGVFLSGTGIASGCTVTDVSPDSKVLTISAATTAAMAGTLTATYNDGTTFFNVLQLNNAFVQGQVS